MADTTKYLVKDLFVNIFHKPFGNRVERKSSQVHSLNVLCNVCDYNRNANQRNQSITAAEIIKYHNINSGMFMIFRFTQDGKSMKINDKKEMGNIWGGKQEKKEINKSPTLIDKMKEN